MSSEFNNWTIKIDDDFVDRKTVENAYRFWKLNTKEKDKEYDKIVKVNWYIMEKYGKDFLQECGINEIDNDFQRCLKVSKLFDKIYNEMTEKYPNMWYEYGFGSNNGEN